MYINKIYDYKPLERISTPEGRKYIVGENSQLPSVTTVLSKVADKSFLIKWREKVGDEKAAQITNESASLGTGMHNNLENYILGKPLDGSFMSQTLAKVIIKHGLSKVSEVWGTEVALYCTGLYAGTTDLVAVHDGIPSIIDFKNSLRLKKEEWITDYKAQLGAYALAHNEMFDTKIHRGVVMIATRDATYQEFVFEGSGFDECISLWLTALDKYYASV
jgi:genome maintenance exonuclease 1